MQNDGRKYIVAWLLSGVGLILIMVVVGGITRLTHSGLSIVEWNVIMGTLPPLSTAEWNATFDLYKQSPEFKELNFHYTLDEFKSIFWWEYVHRLLGRIIGLVFIIPAIYFYFRGWLNARLMPKLVIIFFLGGFQGFLGWYMVKSGLIDVPAVSHYRLAAHLLTAVITCVYTFWVALEVRYEGRWIKRIFPDIRKVATVMAILVLFQMGLGALVAGLKAGLVYNTFPLMGESFVAVDAFALNPWFMNLLENRAGVQFFHRMTGYAIVVFAFVIWLMSRNKQMLFGQRLGVNLVLIITLIQVTLGILTLLLHVPVWLGVLHQIVACVLLLSNMYLIFRLRALGQ